MSALPVIARQKLLVLARPERDAVDLVERDLPPLAPDEALVRILAAGICGTDLQILSWNGWAAGSYRVPLALGHEFCGEIVAVGGDVAGFRVGDRVVAETHLSCGWCCQCRQNRRHTCENLKVFSRLDRGAFADRTTVPAALLRRVPPQLSPALASLFEPLGIAARAATMSEVSGKTVLVTGCGPIGLMTIAVARRFGAHRVIGADVVRERLDLAASLGADIVVDSSRQMLADAVAGIEIDVAIDASGNGRAIADALACVAAGGQLILLGLMDGDVPLDLARHVILREVSIRGVYGRLIDETWLTTERLMADESFDLSPLITHQFALEDFSEAFACARSGRAGKVVFRVADV